MAEASPPAQDGMETEGKARMEGAKRLRIEGEARDKSRGGVRVWGSMSPSPENFSKIDSEMVQSSAYFTSKLPDQANPRVRPVFDASHLSQHSCHNNASPAMVFQVPLPSQRRSNIRTGSATSFCIIRFLVIFLCIVAPPVATRSRRVKFVFFHRTSYVRSTSRQHLATVIRYADCVNRPF